MRLCYYGADFRQSDGPHATGAAPCRAESWCAIRLDPACFVRVHRSTLVNVEHLAEMHPLFHGDYELI
jgi:LytTr DNA-binding domain